MKLSPLGNILSAILTYGAGIVSIISAIGYTAVGISGITQHFAIGEDQYWRQRLLASQLTGTTAFAFTGLMTLVGAWLWRSRDGGMRHAGRMVLLLSTIPSVVSVIELLLLTPQDASHAIPFIAAPVMIGLGIALDQRNKEFVTVRNATISLFEGFDSVALTRAGVANGNIMSVRAAAYHIAGHEMHHINIIKERYLSR